MPAGETVVIRCRQHFIDEDNSCYGLERFEQTIAERIADCDQFFAEVMPENISDVSPPVHAWAVWRVYKTADPKGSRDLEFFEKAFQKLLLNFTWWVNRKDVEGRHVFGSGFLGLDNIGLVRA